MKHFYSTFVSSIYIRDIDAEFPDFSSYDDNVLIAADSPEEAKAKVEAWLASKHRELYRMDESFAMPRKDFVGGWRKHKNGWRWYEVNAFGTKENGKIKAFFGYIFAPNKKFVKDKIVEMGYPAIGYISREDWTEYIK